MTYYVVQTIPYGISPSRERHRGGGRVAVIVTTPLTKDKYCKEFCRGQLLMFNMGLPYSELYDCGEVDREGR